MRKLISCVSLAVLLTGILASCNSPQETADYRVVPLPHEITAGTGVPFVLKDGMKILYPEGNADMQRNAEFLAEYIKESTGKNLEVQTGVSAENAIILSLGLEAAKPETYRLQVTEQGITITAPTPAGVFYGVQTLRKSLPVVKDARVVLPQVTINDAPRFNYRGMMLDVARHFFTVDSIKRYIDLMALHNINRFHWHISDDQGWRIEIKKYPELTQVGAVRKETVIGHNTGKYDGIPYGGFYTQEEAKEIVAYAKDRYITVIPEIDMPGHMQGALAAFPELGCTGGPYEVWQMWGVSEDVLCAGNDKTLEFIEGVLSELIEIFPSEYIHVGGDECPKIRWQNCPKCQAKIKALGLKADKQHSAEERLQSYFISHAERFLNGHGRQIIGWDEILEGGLAPHATVMAWRGVGEGVKAVKQQHDVIMVPTTYLYFDYYQAKDKDREPMAIGGYVPLEKVYSFDPVPAGLSAAEAQHIIGTQANLWTEYITSFRQVEYMVLPRMDALSEIQWVQPENKNYEDFLSRMPKMFEIYDLHNLNYARHLFDVAGDFTPNDQAGILEVTLTTLGDAKIHYTLDGLEPTTASPAYENVLKVKEDCVLKAVAVRPSGNSHILTEKIAINKATLKPVTLSQPVNKQYGFKGAPTLVDGLKGGPNYKTGRWIAFYGNDLEAVVDLMQPEKITKAGISTCVEKGDWIFDARELKIEISEDGKNYKEVASEKFPAMEKESRNGVYDHVLTFDPVQARYVKVTAVSEKQIPDWHGGKGKLGFLFIDEISVD